MTKATFDLAPGSAMTLAEEQKPPAGDEYYPGDEEQAGSLRYVSDFSPFKPQADLMLVGTCKPPGGKAVPVCRVVFRVNNQSKCLAVFGDRHWKSGFLSSSPSHPEPFTEMDVRYERSFGGSSFKRNPIGIGREKTVAADGTKTQVLPNIEDPNDLIYARGNRPEPAGFGPLSQMWPQRLKKAGTFTKHYKDERWPWYPEDIDPTYFNAAPLDMLYGGYLRGDEEVYIENMHADFPQYRTYLPGLRVRCFVNRRKDGDPPQPEDGSPPEVREFAEVPMNLDTLWVDADAEQAVLLWRGWIPVSSEEAPEIDHVFTLSEPLDSPPQAIETCRALFVEAATPKQPEISSPEEEPPHEPEPLEAPEPEEEEEEQGMSDADMDAIINQAERQMREALTRAGVDPKLMPKVDRKQVTELLDGAPEEQARKMQRESERLMRQAGMDPNRPLSLTPEVRAKRDQMLRDMGIDPAFAAQAENWFYARKQNPDIPPPDPDQPPAEAPGTPGDQPGTQAETGAPAPGGNAPAETTEPPAPTLTRQDVTERVASGHSLAGENLSGLDLNGLKLAGADLAETDLSGATLTNADLTGAILTGAKLSGANLQGAVLTTAVASGTELDGANLQGTDCTQADFSGAAAQSADLSGAILVGSVWAGAALTNATLTRARANNASFGEADLEGAKLWEGAFDRCDFKAAKLARAQFTRARLAEALFQGVQAAEAELNYADVTKLMAQGADFTAASFREAHGAQGNYTGATLARADLSFARMPNGLLAEADLAGANLYGSDMKQGRFTKANLKEARLVQMNLFEANLENADLRGADLSGSNCYGAQMGGVLHEGARAEGTNFANTLFEE